MITARIKIGAGNIVDTYSGYGLIYVSSDNRFDAPIKSIETTSYPEEEGEHINTNIVQDAFDYKVTFLIEGYDTVNGSSTLAYVNQKIAAFNSATRLSGVLQPVTFYNDHKHIVIKGYAMPIEEATDFWKGGSGSDAAMVELTIRVIKPSECNFNASV